MITVSLEEREKLMDRAEQYWSEEEHRNQLIEECGELIVALQHLKREKTDKLEVIKEMIDVEIMLDRFKISWLRNTNIDWNIVKGWKLIEMKETMDEGRK